MIGQNSNADNNVNRNFELPDFIHSCSLVVYCGLWLKIRYFASFFQHPVRTPNARTHTNKNYINWLVSWIRLEQTNIKSCIATVRFLCNIITFYIFFLCGLGFTKFTEPTVYEEFTMASSQARKKICPLFWKKRYSSSTTATSTTKLFRQRSLYTILFYCCDRSIIVTTFNYATFRPVSLLIWTIQLKSWYLKWFLNTSNFFIGTI